MSFIIVGVVAAVIGAGMGYGFRGLIHRDIQNAAGAVNSKVTQIGTDLSKKL